MEETTRYLLDIATEIDINGEYFDLQPEHLTAIISAENAGRARNGIDCILSDFIACRHTAILCRKRGNVRAAMVHEARADAIYKTIPIALRW
jgi:hypothetical protein